MSKTIGRWSALFALNAVCLCVLGFYQNSNAQTSNVNPPPFANAVEQRQQMIAALKEINVQLKEQNALLRSGKLKVVVSSK